MDQNPRLNAFLEQLEAEKADQDKKHKTEQVELTEAVMDQ